MEVILIVVTIFTVLAGGQFKVDADKRELEYLTKCMENHDTTKEEKQVCIDALDKLD